MLTTTRRRFLLAMAGLGTLATIPLAQVVIARKTPSVTTGELADGLRSFSQTGYALGSKVTIQVIHGQERTARAALAAAFDQLRTVEEIMSIYRPDSQLSQLNRAGSLDHPHPYLLQVLQQSQQLAQDSHGAFDITVQPLWNLHCSAHAAGRTPSQQELEQAMQLVGYEKLHVQPDRIQFKMAGMSVVLNGIAQGFAADRVMAALGEHGISHALVNTGEVGPLGRNLSNLPWRVGIQHPRIPQAYIALAELEGLSLATSGDYETTFTPDRRNNHVFDPSTGRSPTQLASVTVTAPSTTLADGLSTALFVLGPQKGEALLQSIPRAQALYVLKDGSVLSTPGFPKIQA